MVYYIDFVAQIAAASFFLAPLARKKIERIAGIASEEDKDR